jgi:DNA-binding MarR family transcriptional regulator
MHWTDELHAAVLSLADFINRSDVDARLLVESGVTLDRALFPLLSRIGAAGEIGTVALSNLVGRDHSTVSRQVAKLEKIGLVCRVPCTKDARIKHLTPTGKGNALLDKVRVVRRRIMENHFCGWRNHERDALIRLLQKLVIEL